MTAVGYVVGASLCEIQDQWGELLDFEVNIILFDRYFLNNSPTLGVDAREAIWHYMETMRAGQGVSNNRAGYEFLDDLKEGDTLVIRSLSILANAAPDFWDAFMEANSNGVHLVALDYSFQSSGGYGDSVIAMLDQMYNLGRGTGAKDVKTDLPIGNERAETMKSEPVDPKSLKIDPNNKNWTLPKSWGVWETPALEDGSAYHEGNYPVREKELIREYGEAKLVALYLDKASAVEHKAELNGKRSTSLRTQPKS